MKLTSDWRTIVPHISVPRHPLWVAAYEGAWDALGQQGSLPDDGLAMLTARYAAAGAESDAVQSGETPPQRAWAEWLWFQATGDLSRVTRMLPLLVAHYEMRKSVWRRASGLYGAATDELLTPRDGVERVDVSAQEALAAECIAQLAAAIQQPDCARVYDAEWHALRDSINQHGWDANRRWYMDRGLDGVPSAIQHAASGWALIAGIPSAAQAKAMIAQLVDPQKFWRVHVFASLAADQPRYADRGARWRGAVWPLLNYAIIKGLERYGWHELAYRAADNHVTTIAQVFKETDSHWDNYAPDYIEPGSIAQPDFAPSAGLGSVALLIETLYGLRVDAPARMVHWRPRVRKEYAIERLRVGAASLTLHVGESGRRAHIQTTAPIRLRLLGAESEQIFDVRNELIYDLQSMLQ